MSIGILDPRDSGHDRSDQQPDPEDIHDAGQIIGEDREGHLGGCSPFAREFFPIAHRLELAAVDGNARRYEKAHLTAKFDKPRTYPAKRQAIVFAEVRNRLVIRSEPTQQPHNLDIAPGFSFEPPARLHPL